ncbi:PaaI family thioesterase [Haloarchaeobius sp. DFWS5]|uniref:PaaI family thioesterase n=1 Tax=Haloarchaeobius sp. DFWS5 TaxID=3446114 RepID=UPI003EBAACDB
MEAYIASHGYLSWLGLGVESVERGRIVMSVPHDDKFQNVALPGQDAVETTPVHGGILATLVDTSSGFVLRTTWENPANAKLTTTDLDVKYLRPATGDLTVTAEVVRAGGSMGVADVTVESVDSAGDCREVAVGQTSYRLFRE